MNAKNTIAADAESLLALCGFDHENVHDPSEMSVEDIESGGWVLVTVEDGEILRFGVSGENVKDPLMDGHEGAVEFGTLGSKQPIGFDTVLNDLSTDMAAYGASVTVFAKSDGTDESVFRTLSKEESVELLEWLKFDSWVPLPMAKAISEPFGVESLDNRTQEDSDVDNGYIIRAVDLLRECVKSEGLGWKSESGYVGHTKTRMEEWSANYPKLVESVD